MNLEGWLKVLSMVGAVIVFAVGVWEFQSSQRSQVETRRVEATKPFLEKQLALYAEAARAAAMRALTPPQSLLDRSVGKRDLRREGEDMFWRLYYGELALVEDRTVARAMVAFGDALKENAPDEILRSLSLDLAHACRDSLASSWNVYEWQAVPGKGK